jgi:hypothetical protein
MRAESRRLRDLVRFYAILELFGGAVRGNRPTIDGHTVVLLAAGHGSDGAPRRGGGARVPPGARLDPAQRRPSPRTGVGPRYDSTSTLGLPLAEKAVEVLSVRVRLTTPSSQPPAARTEAPMVTSGIWAARRGRRIAPEANRMALPNESLEQQSNLGPWLGLDRRADLRSAGCVQLRATAIRAGRFDLNS